MKNLEKLGNWSKILSIIAVITVVFAGACSKQKGHPDHPDWPAKIQIAYLPDEEQPGRRLDMYRQLESYLERELSIQVDVVRTNLYGPVIEAMRSGKIDVAFFSTFSYMLASDRDAAESIVMRSEVDGSPRVYYSNLIVGADSPLTSFEDMVDQAGELVLSFVNPASTSGHLLPRAWMLQRDFNPEASFREVVYSGSQNGSIYSILSGKADVAAASSANLLKLIKTGSVDENAIRVIWESPEIPGGCTAVRKNLPASLKAALKTAYLDIEENDPELFESIQSIYREYLPDGVEPGSYIPCPDSTFDPLRELIRSLEGLDILK
jgi:phosphonate transport system substrate-binding protein